MADPGIERPVLNVVGCGKLGSTLARLLAQSGAATLGGLYSRTPGNAENARQFAAAGTVCATLAELPPAGLWLLSVADDAIAEIARQLARLFPDWHATTVFHASGLHSSALLAPLQSQGAITASLHPVHSFGHREKSLVTFAGSCCTLEGNPAATAPLSRLLAPLQVRLLSIDTEAKPLYHAATAMASNYMVSLMAASLSLLEKAGIGEADARALLGPLASQTAANVFARGPAAALTGPIARGDRETVARHIAAITAAAPETLELYRSLGKATLDLASRGGKLAPSQACELAAVLAADARPAGERTEQ